MRSVVLVLTTIVATGCAARARSRAEAEDACRRSFNLEYCAFETVDMGPAVLREFRGLIVPEGGLEWDSGTEVRLTVKRVTDPRWESITVADNRSGAFVIRDLPDALYCYQAQVRPFGFACVTGTARVRKDAALDARLNLVAPLGR